MKKKERLSAEQSGGIAFHALEVDEVFKLIDATPNGLTQSEVEQRLAKYGPNRLRPPKRRSWLGRIFNQFHNILIYVLIVAAAITALLGYFVDTAVILAVVVINAIIGFVQEGKAEKALESIRKMLVLSALALRDGNRISIPAEDLLPGDIVFIRSGDKVPADLRLIKVKDLQIDESMLTGESVPVNKSKAPVAEKTSVGDRLSMAFSGTLVTYGRGTGVVVATGDATEIGRISALLEEVQTITTPLLRKIGSFGRVLTIAIVAVAAITFAFGILIQGYSPVEMFFAVVGIAVAAIPEGLPAIMTITLAIGVQRMARRNAIIRLLPAVETLGSVTVICSDKTGTLTRNEMTAQTVVTSNGTYEVAGVGYVPHGAFFLEGKEVSPNNHPDLIEVARSGLLCNDATIYEHDCEWVLEGNPTEGALVTLALKAGLDHEEEQKSWPRIDTIPFESERRFMATLHRNQRDNGVIYVKGAPERVLEMCTNQQDSNGNSPLDTSYWSERIKEIASEGKRMLAVAFRSTAAEQHSLRFSDVDTNLTLLGLFGIIDPPREEAISSVRECRDAGIRVKMITGDHALTASAIGLDVGIGDGATVLTGLEVEELSDEELFRAVEEVEVFARVSPEHKLRLVKALQANGHIVAMTGDGVNDAPALKRADVGIAMGIKGTEVSKDAAEMVLADDNFASIAHAVEEGRTVYDNLRKAILFILPTNGGEALTIIAAILVGRTLPITPVQVLWVNMITAVTLALALAFEPPEEGVMRRPPRDPKESILSPYFLWRIAYVSIILLAGTFGLFVWMREQGVEIEAARTIAVNTLVMFEVFYLLNTRYITAPVFNREGLFGNLYVLIAIALVIVFQLLFTYLPVMHSLFDTSPIHFGDWLLIVAISVSVLVIVEIEKLVMRRAEN